MTAPGTLGHELGRVFAPPGACVWGLLCTVPETQGHLCPVCSTSAHSTCTYTNVCAFAESQRARNSGADPASAELQYTVAVEEADTPGCPVCRNLPSLAAVVCRVSGSAGAGCGGSGATSVRTRATTSTSVPSETPSRRTRASSKTAPDALEQVASGRKRTAERHAWGAKGMGRDDGVAPDDNPDSCALGTVALANPEPTEQVASGRKRGASPPRHGRGAKRVGRDDGVAPDDNTDSCVLGTVALANPEPTTTAAPMTESTTAAPMTESSETVATPPFDYGQQTMNITDLGAAVPPRATVSDSITFVSAGAKTAEGTGTTASDTGLSAAGTCTSRSSTLLVFDNLRALLLEVVICCVYTRFVRVLTGF